MPLFTVKKLREDAARIRQQKRLFADEEAEPEEEELEPLDEEASEVYTILEIGDQVGTPDGPGEVVNISLHGADYGDRHELEPPAISVKLEDGTETTVCPCVIELEDEELTDLLHDEYNRLWPPMEELPGDAQRLVDDEKLEHERANFSKRFMRAYRRATRFATHLTTAAGPLAPGMVLEDLEGVELGDKGAVVVEVNVQGDDQTVKLYFPDTEETKTVKLSVDSEHRALEHVPSESSDGKVYDSDVIDEGEVEGLIRRVPDSYIPKNPNYPSTLSDALWRPTYRQWPQYPGLTWASADDEDTDMRRRRADYGSPYNYEDAERDDPYYTQDDWFDFPLITEQDVVEEDWDPDLQPSPERLYENPIALFDPEKSPKKLYDLASELWEEYQTYRHKKVPGVTWDHGNMPFTAYCFVFMQTHGVRIPEMNELWDYMEEIGFMTMRERRQWDEALNWDRLEFRRKVYPSLVEEV
jgi:hypothetical protein